MPIESYEEELTARLVVGKGDCGGPSAFRSPVRPEGSGKPLLRSSDEGLGGCLPVGKGGEGG